MTESFLAMGQPGQLEDDAARETRHQALATLLGAYADGELPVETSSHIDAHLLGCNRCRHELSLQRALGNRLGRIVVPAATPALQQRIRYAITSTPVEPTPESSLESWAARRLSGMRSIALSAVAIVFVVASVVLFRAWNSDTAASPVIVSPSVTAISQILDEYKRLTAGDLPGRARDLESVRGALPFPVVPLQHPDAHLLAAWTTDFDGEPAAVLAYRWNATVVLQFVVAESMLFRSLELRNAFAAGREVAVHINDIGLVAWPDSNAGSAVVGRGAPTDLRLLRRAGNR